MEFSFDDLRTLIIQSYPSLDQEKASQAARFGQLLYQENQSQNLTRIMGASGFLEGHFKDVVELFKMDSLGLSVADIGSGSGVPGLLAAAIDPNPNRRWFLIESEKGKAEYLERSRVLLNLRTVKVIHDRAEAAIKSLSPDTVMARAVGRVDKIAAWIDQCSTWNNLILFKAKGWDQEWQVAQKTRFGKKLTVSQKLEYSSDEKIRFLVNLKRK